MYVVLRLGFMLAIVSKVSVHHLRCDEPVFRPDQLHPISWCVLMR